MSEKPVSDLFRLSEEEAFVLAGARWWLMNYDLANDPDEADQVAKRPVVLEYGLELHRACQKELFFEEVPECSREAILERMRAPGWTAPLRRSLGDADYDTVAALFEDEAFVTGLLKTVSRRDRGVLFAVELASFYPWPPEVKYEAGVREKGLERLVDGMAAPVTTDYLRELDRALIEQAKRLARKNIDWRKMGLLAGGSAALMVLSGGVAGIFVGTAMGAAGGGVLAVAAADLGGAGATLFGNPIASGNYSVAGRSLGEHSVVAADAEATLADLAKVHVLTEYLLIKERSDPGMARFVATRLEEKLRRSEREAEDLRERVAELERLADMNEAMTELVVERETELAGARSRLAEAEQTIAYQQRENEELCAMLDGSLVAAR